MKKFKRVSAQRRWLKIVGHVEKFMDENSLFSPSGTYYLAVSGGVDSIFGLHLFVQMLKLGICRKVIVLHVNHGTRPECLEEEQFISSLCEQIKIPIYVKKLDLSQVKGNFEKLARDCRYRFFKSFGTENDRLVLFHHLDDSFEWSLMVQFKSSETSSMIGIPVINGRIIRPFMCLSRQQILWQSKKLNLMWKEDKSNNDLSFERNFVRSELVLKIKARFPQYLQHYIARSKRLALDIGLLRNSKKINFSVENLPLQCLAIFHPEGKNDFSGALEHIYFCVKKLGKNERGVLREQVYKLIDMVKREKMGPLTFSGGVLAFSTRGAIFFLSKESLKKYEKWDLIWSKQLDNLGTQIPVAGLNLKNRLCYVAPQYVFFSNLENKRISSLKQLHPLIPRTCKKAKELGISFRPLSYFIQKNNLKGRFFYLIL